MEQGPGEQSAEGSPTDEEERGEPPLPRLPSIGGHVVTPNLDDTPYTGFDLFSNLPKITDNRALREYVAIAEEVESTKERIRRTSEMSEYFEFSNVLKTLKSLYEETNETPSTFFLWQLGEKFRPCNVSPHDMVATPREPQKDGQGVPKHRLEMCFEEIKRLQQLQQYQTQKRFDGYLSACELRSSILHDLQDWLATQQNAMGLRLVAMLELPPLFDETTEANFTRYLEQFLDFFSRAVHETRNLSSEIFTKMECMLTKKMQPERQLASAGFDSSSGFIIPTVQTLMIDRNKWCWGRKKVEDLLSLGEKLAETQESKNTLQHGMELFHNMMAVAEDKFQDMNAAFQDLQEMKKTFLASTKNFADKKKKMTELEQRRKKLADDCHALTDKLIVARMENEQLEYEVRELEFLFRNLAARPTPAPRIIPFPFPGDQQHVAPEPSHAVAFGRSTKIPVRKRIETPDVIRRMKTDSAKIQEEIEVYKTMIANFTEKLGALKAHSNTLEEEIASLLPTPSEEVTSVCDGEEEEEEEKEKAAGDLREDQTLRLPTPGSPGSPEHKHPSARSPAPTALSTPAGRTQSPSPSPGPSPKESESMVNLKAQLQAARAESLEVGRAAFPRDGSGVRGSPRVSVDMSELSPSDSLYMALDDFFPSVGAVKLDARVYETLDPNFVKELENTRDDCIHIIHSFLVLGTRLSHMLDSRGIPQLGKKVRMARARLARLILDRSIVITNMAKSVDIYFQEIFKILKQSFLDLDMKPGELRLKELRDERIADMTQKIEILEVRQEALNNQYEVLWFMYLRMAEACAQHGRDTSNVKEKNEIAKTILNQVEGDLFISDSDLQHNMQLLQDAFRKQKITYKCLQDGRACFTELQELPDERLRLFFCIYLEYYHLEARVAHVRQVKTECADTSRLKKGFEKWARNIMQRRLGHINKLLHEFFDFRTKKRKAFFDAWFLTNKILVETGLQLIVPEPYESERREDQVDRYFKLMQNLASSKTVPNIPPAQVNEAILKGVPPEMAESLSRRGSSSRDVDNMDFKLDFRALIVDAIAPRGYVHDVQDRFITQLNDKRSVEDTEKSLQASLKRKAVTFCANNRLSLRPSVHEYVNEKMVVDLTPTPVSGYHISQSRILETEDEDSGVPTNAIDSRLSRPSANLTATYDRKSVSSADRLNTMGSSSRNLSKDMSGNAKRVSDLSLKKSPAVVSSTLLKTKDTSKNEKVLPSTSAAAPEALAFAMQNVFSPTSAPGGKASDSSLRIKGTPGLLNTVSKASLKNENSSSASATTTNLPDPSLKEDTQET